MVSPSHQLPVELSETSPLDVHLRQGAALPRLVSVVIPTYNRACVVGAAIESVIAQSYGCVEVIVVDDGSTDDTKQVVACYGERVRYVHQPNAGVSAARKLGLRHARGEFVAFLDSDDRWFPWKLDAQVAILRRFGDIGMVWTDMRAVDDQGAVLQETYLRTFYSAYNVVRIENECNLRGRLDAVWPGAPSEAASRPVYVGDIFSAMILGNLVHTSTVLLRRDRLVQVGGFDTSLASSGEDYEYHLRTCFFGPVGFLDAASIDYRIGASDQLTAPQFMVPMARNSLTTVRRWLDRGGERVRLPRETVRRRLADSYTWLGEEEYLGGAPRRGAQECPAGTAAGSRTKRSHGCAAASHVPASTGVHGCLRNLAAGAPAPEDDCDTNLIRLYAKTIATRSEGDAWMDFGQNGELK